MRRIASRYALLFATLSTISCKRSVPMEKNDQPEPPIACVLNSLTPEERHREGELLELHLDTIRERRERPDGYSFRYPEDPALFAKIAELVSLEHRCCPFLDFQLQWSGAESAPWLHITGGARVKPFVADTFGSPHD